MTAPTPAPLQLLLTPMLYFCIGGMLASGGYLVWQGYWQPLWAHVVILFSAPLAFPFLMMPATLLAATMANKASSNPGLALMLERVTLIYLVTLLALYSAVSFNLVGSLMNGDTLTASLFWAVFATSAPWFLFVTFDRGNLLMTVLALRNFFASIAGAVAIAFLEIKFWGFTGLMLALIGIPTLLQYRAEKR